MKRLNILLLACSLLPLPFSLSASVPLRWTVETSRLQPAVFEAVRGETLALEASFNSYGRPVATSNLTAFLCWQTNGMENAWWVTNAVTTASVARVLFTPSMDPGAPTVNAFIGLSSTNDSNILNSNIQTFPSLSYRAAFTLRFRHGPGATPNVIDLPPRILDLAHTVVVNPPWPTQADFAATTSVMRAELKGYVDDQIEGAGTVSTQGVTKISGQVTSNVVTKSYVEGLGIEAGLTEAQVKALVKSSNLTNEGAMAYADATYRTKTDNVCHANGFTEWTYGGGASGLSGLSVCWADWERVPYWKLFKDGSNIADSNNTNPAATFVVFDEYNPGVFTSDPTASRKMSATSGQPFVTADNVASTNGFVTAHTATGIVESVTAPISAKADQANLYSSGIYQYMTGNTNAWFSGTNYVTTADATNRTHFAWEDGMDSATVPCSLALWEIRNGQRQVVWDQRDWTAWYWTFKASQLSNSLAAATAALAAEVGTNCMKRGWANYTAVRGLDNPDPSALVVDTPKVQLFAGHNWEKLVETGGAGYWTLTGNGIELSAADATNAFLTVKDFEGNACLTFRKTSSYLAYCECGTDITNNYYDAQGRVVFRLTTDVQPTAEFSTTLDLDDFVAQGDAGCPANCEWTGSAGSWDCHFLLKPGIASSCCFARFKVMREGQNVIEHTIPIKINGGIVFDHNGQSVKIRPTVTSTAVGSSVNWVVAQ